MLIIYLFLICISLCQITATDSVSFLAIDPDYSKPIEEIITSRG